MKCERCGGDKPIRTVSGEDLCRRCIQDDAEYEAMQYTPPLERE